MSQKKSLAEHALQGTQARHADPGESRITGALPRPPEHLDKQERKKFKQLAQQLSDRRAVTQGDGDLIAIYCSQNSRWLQALKQIKEQGVVVTYQRLGSDGLSVDVEKPNLHLAIAKDAERSMVVILTRLGLTPKDRESVRPTSPAKPKKEVLDPNSPAARIFASFKQDAAPQPAATTDDDAAEAEEAARIEAAMEQIS